MKKSMLLGGIFLFLNSIHAQAIPMGAGETISNCMRPYSCSGVLSTGDPTSTRDPAIERRKKEQNCIVVTTNHPNTIGIIHRKGMIGSNEVTICGDNKYGIRDRICTAITCY